MIACARDFMIDHGFCYAIPPFMIRSDVVTGVMRVWSPIKFTFYWVVN